MVMLFQRNASLLPSDIVVSKLSFWGTRGDEDTHVVPVIVPGDSIVAILVVIIAFAVDSNFPQQSEIVYNTEFLDRVPHRGSCRHYHWVQERYAK